MMKKNKAKLTEKDIKAVELNLLLELKKICESYELDYHLIAGTLLGAVRHGGFIPWDDDIDIGMPRPDYNKLIELYRQGAFPENIKLLSFELGNFERPFGKLVDTRTEVKNQNAFLKDGNAESLWIDIMPIDGLPDNDKDSDKLFKKTRQYYKMVCFSNAYLGKGASPVRAIAKSVLSLFARLLGSSYWNKAILREVGKYPFETSQYVGEVAFTRYGSKERMTKSEYQKRTDVSFEGHLFPAVADWNKYLTALYGDYMQLPPEGKRETHSIEAWASFEKDVEG